MISDWGTYDTPPPFKDFVKARCSCSIMWCYLQQRWRAFCHLQQVDESRLHQERSLAAGTPTAWRVETGQIQHKKGYIPILMGVTDIHIDSVQDFMISIFTNLPCGRRMLLTPPSLTLIFRQRLERVWGVVFWTFFTCTHCVAMPSTVSPTRFTSAVTHSRTIRKY